MVNHFFVAIGNRRCWLSRRFGVFWHMRQWHSSWLQQFGKWSLPCPLVSRGRIIANQCCMLRRMAKCIHLFLWYRGLRLMICNLDPFWKFQVLPTTYEQGASVQWALWVCREDRRKGGRLNIIVGLVLMEGALWKDL